MRDCGEYMSSWKNVDLPEDTITAWSWSLVSDNIGKVSIDRSIDRSNMQVKLSQLIDRSSTLMSIECRRM